MTEPRDGRSADANGEKIAASASNCSRCPHIKYGLCGALTDGGATIHPKVPKGEITVRARQTLSRPADEGAVVCIVREGVAQRYVVLADGRRQIVSFRIPGDLLAVSFILGQKTNTSIQAVTPMRLCVFDRAAVAQFVKTTNEGIEAIAESYASEKRLLEARVVDLGKRSAAQRIARLMLEFAARTEHLRAPADPIPFPLTQQHIADALGLTQVHVSRVMGRMRKAGLVHAANGALTLHDADALVQMAAGKRS